VAIAGLAVAPARAMMAGAPVYTRTELEHRRRTRWKRRLSLAIALAIGLFAAWRLWDRTETAKAVLQEVQDKLFWQ